LIYGICYLWLRCTARWRIMSRLGLADSWYDGDDRDTSPGVILHETCASSAAARSCEPGDPFGGREATNILFAFVATHSALLAEQAHKREQRNASAKRR
jgi:hypothetical protein